MKNCEVMKNCESDKNCEVMKNCESDEHDCVSVIKKTVIVSKNWVV